MTKARDERAIGRFLHEQLLRQDPDVKSLIYIEYRDRLRAGVSAKARANGERSPDDEMVMDAVVEAITTYLVRPAIFDPEKKSLLGFLYMSAWFDYVNLVDKRKRRVSTIVGIDDEVWNRFKDDDAQSFEDDVADEDDSELVRRLKDHCVKTTEDRIIYGLIVDRIRETDRGLAALGWIPGADSTERLRNAKERIVKCLRRTHSRFVQENQ
jgi:DNA-directed RNA polymerase specialized sigma24 family protein